MCLSKMHRAGIIYSGDPNPHLGLKAIPSNINISHYSLCLFCFLGCYKKKQPNIIYGYFFRLKELNHLLMNCVHCVLQCSQVYVVLHTLSRLEALQSVVFSNSPPPLLSCPMLKCEAEHWGDSDSRHLPCTCRCRGRWGTCEWTWRADCLTADSRISCHCCRSWSRRRCLRLSSCL